ncbi:hypothetical protein TELCIR_22605 [Teladorsagia circumcincta]|uniref:TIR domain-containing protein n=1 Tax=Teladorsagia circumcincta TaxID=45464 RepID=A0A2G9TDG9_TELCI|nr:hypothetical protein TELCIR_22605 [Teladorsagia circumcincta]
MVWDSKRTGQSYFLPFQIAADYSAVDESNLDQLLMSLSPELSVYTYKMLSCGINRSLLGSLTDELMQTACGITNPIHRLKMTQAFQNAKHPDEVEVAVLSKQIDVFISYRRSTGNQLASLIKVLLQLKGYKVFIDVDKLYAGKFDSSLLKNIQAAKHFILVLTPNSLDRLLNDHNGDDWIHKEVYGSMTIKTHAWAKLFVSSRENSTERPVFRHRHIPRHIRDERPVVDFRLHRRAFDKLRQPVIEPDELENIRRRRLLVEMYQLPSTAPLTSVCPTYLRDFYSIRPPLRSVL